ncbi:Uncharacterised protein [Mycobacterium tuberculosis]|nr:Uncharacterised protein [Mycobacterium tuberculosis]
MAQQIIERRIARVSGQNDAFDAAFNQLEDDIAFNLRRIISIRN